ncbi:MAG: hypothetical protein H8D95_01310 [Candidatus Endolissoclinum sp.]|nr:hypothetical protein [Candidatus Endolissoclinum sp.]
MSLLSKKQPEIKEEYFSVVYWYTTPLRKGVNRVKNGSARRMGYSAFDVAEKRIKEQFRTAGLSDEPFEILRVEDVSDFCHTLSDLVLLEKGKIHSKMKDMGMWYEVENHLSEWYVGDNSIDDVIEIGLKIINDIRKTDGMFAVYRAMTPRDSFFTESLEDNDTRFQKFQHGNPGLGIAPLRIFQHWPAATGKGSFPRLAYDMTFNPAWDYSSKGFQINTVVNPRIVVLKGNVLLNVEHDLALGNDNNHLIFATDIVKGTTDEQELKVLQGSGVKVITNPIEFIRYVKENADKKNLWIHTTIHSYGRMAKLLSDLDKSIYFSHIDEVHHTVLPEGAPWTAPLDDRSIPVTIRFMTSANIRVARKTTGGGAKWSMNNPDWCDYKIKSLTEKKAVDLGYKRQTNIVYMAYDKTNLPSIVGVLIGDGRNPMIEIDGYDTPVPLHWVLSADGLIQFRIDNLEYHHTKCTLNKIDRCAEFGRYLEHILVPTLKHKKVDNEVFARLSKAKVFVADTKAKNTTPLIREIERIPSKHEDSFLIHCQLLGEGWSPKNGWVDSTMFVDPVWSPLRIYQDLNRGTRIGDGSIKIHPIIMIGFEPEGISKDCNFTNMFRKIWTVGKVIEMGVEDIKDRIIIGNYKKLPTGGGTRKTGTDEVQEGLKMSASDFTDALTGFWSNGKSYQFGETVCLVVEDWIEAYEKYGLWLATNNSTGPTKMIMDAIIIKHWHFFEQYSSPRDIFRKIVSCQDFRVMDMAVEIDTFMERKVKERNSRYSFLQENITLLENNPDKLRTKYVKTFGQYDTIDRNELDGHEDKLKYEKKYKYKNDKDFTWVTWFRDVDTFAIRDYKQDRYTSVVDVAEELTETKVEKRNFIARLFRKRAA